MVQKKAPDKRRSPAEPKRNHAKPEKRLYSLQNQHQESRGSGGCGAGGGGGGGELKKMLKKSRSIKVLEESLGSPVGAQLVQIGNPAIQKNKKKKKRPPFPAALPNYMKSTRSSTAKTEQPQVSSPDLVGNKLSDSSSKMRIHGHGGDLPARMLARISSLRAMRPSMKKILGIPLSPKINASRATCSSTIKETTFPDHLELSPGATEVEGTSAFKVCPYTYCSLNGHRHEPLPPLRCLLSARRRLIKAQKSLKLRGLPSFRKTEPVKEGDKIAGAGGGVSSLVEDLGDEFVLEIYTKCPPVPVESDGGKVHPIADDGMASCGDEGKVDCLSGIVDKEGRSVDDSASMTTLDEDFDQISEFSPAEMEVLLNFLEYVECDPEDPPCPDGGRGGYWRWDRYILDDCSGNGTRVVDEEGVCKLPCSAAADFGGGRSVDFYIDFDEIEYSEFSEDESSDGVSFPTDANGIAYGEDSPGAIFTLPEDECDEKDEEIGEGIGETVGGNVTVEDVMAEIEELFEKHLTDQTVSVTAEDGLPIGDLVSFGYKKNSDDTHAADIIDDLTAGIELLFCDDDLHTAGGGEKQAVVTEELDKNEDGNMEVGAWQSEEGGDQPSPSEGLREMPAKKVDYPSASSDKITDTGGKDSAVVGTVSAPKSVKEEETSKDPRARGFVITRRQKSADEEDKLRAFNPRAPNFLPVESELDGEKVDLRHQMMDERKNSEEWMMDYALRQAVDKLATGRKKKVAVLVEAFETVVPVPPYGSTLGHATVGFPHARPIQACS